MGGRRILHVSDVFAPRVGGQEAQVRELAIRQAAAGDEVHVVTVTLGPAGERGGAVSRDEGVYVHRVGARAPFALPVNPVAGALLRSTLANLAPDLVHLHVGRLPVLAYEGARLALDGAVPGVVTLYDLPGRGVARLRGLGARTERLALTAVSGVAAQRAQLLLGRPVEVLPPGIDVAAWAPRAGRPDRAGEHGPLRLLAATRFGPRQRAVQLVRVVAAAARRLPPDRLRLRMIGAGPARRVVESAVMDLGLGHTVELVGRLEPAQVRTEHERAEVFLAPSRTTAFGRSALEARAAGLVVLGWRGTGLADFLVDGTDGVLVDDDEQMTEALVRLARDLGLLAGMRERNRQVPPSAFDWSAVLPATDLQYARAARLASA